MNRTRLMLWILTVLAALPGALFAQADPAKLAGEDTIFFLSVPNASQLVERFKQTGEYGLYRDPAMQPFVAPTEKKITDAINEQLAKGWDAIGMPKPEKYPWPRGRIVLILNLNKKMVERPDWANWRPNEDNERPKMKMVAEPEPSVAVLADMGEDVGLLKELANKIIAAGIEKDEIRKQTEMVGGVEVTILLNKRGDKAADIETDSLPCLAFKDSSVIVASNLKMIRQVIGRLGGGGEASLADNPGYKAVNAAFGAGERIVAYFNAQSLIQFFKDGTEDANEREQMTKMLGVLGLDNVQGVGLGVELAPDKTVDLRLKLQVAIRGERRGLAAILAPPNMPTKPGPNMTKDLSGFITANYDVSKLIDQIIKMAEAATGQNIYEEMDKAMAETGGAGEQAPVNVRKELISQMAGPLAVLFKHTRPFTAADSSTTLLAIGLRDAKVFDTAVGRLHGMATDNDAQMRRELLNTRIYLTPNPFGQLTWMLGLGFGSPSRKSIGTSIVGDQLLLGSLGWVEQAIRDKDNKPESIATDPLYQHAAKFLPAQAGAFMYWNNQIGAERLWGQLKESAKRGAAGPGMRIPPADLKPLPPDGFKTGMRLDEDDDDTFGEMSGGILDILVMQLREWVDFSTLPEFTAVRKHFGATVGWLSGNDQGIYLEILGIKSPQ